MDQRLILLHIWIMLWNQLPAAISCPRMPALYQCERGWRWENRCFADFDLWITLQGEGELTVSGEDFPVSRGEGVLFFPGDSVMGRHNPDKPLRVFAAHFELNDLKLTRELQTAVARPLHFHDAAKCEAIAMEMINRSEEDRTSGLDELLIAQLISQAARDAATRILDPVDQKIKSLCVEITANPGADWEPKKLARIAGLSMPQFNRRFRAVTGASPARYLITRKIDRARKLLAETPMTLSEIAEALGYSDVFYFHRQFRAETGRTPRASRIGD